MFEAARALGADDRVLASWMGALGVGMGATCIALSLAYRAPIVTAWSTPGAALLATSTANVPLAKAVGAFVLCGAMLTAAGASGSFERSMRRSRPRVSGTRGAGRCDRRVAGRGAARAGRGDRGPRAAQDDRQLAGGQTGDETHREAAIVTFLVTASGVSLAGIGSAFWGLAAGLAMRAILAPRIGRGP